MAIVVRGLYCYADSRVNIIHQYLHKCYQGHLQYHTNRRSVIDALDLTVSEGPYILVLPKHAW